MTREVLKLDKSIEFNEEQPKNMDVISVTCKVLKGDKLIDFNEEQPKNIRAISVTSEVLKLDKSTSEILIHPLNIFSQSTKLSIHVNNISLSSCSKKYE